MHLSKGILTKYFDEWKEEKEKKKKKNKVFR
jgi:hypothetical protein